MRRTTKRTTIYELARRTDAVLTHRAANLMHALYLWQQRNQATKTLAIETFVASLIGLTFGFWGTLIVLQLLS